MTQQYLKDGNDAQGNINLFDKKQLNKFPT